MRYLLTHLIDQAAERNPDAEAMRCRGISVDYQTLAERSNQLAQLLNERGVRRGDRVGILMNKRVECAVALFGIMKSGAAYVPLDPAAPTSRHAFVIRDCGIQHLISEPRKRGAVTSLLKEVQLSTVIGCELDDEASCESLPFAALEAYEARRTPATSAMEQDLAYILYTSGSTGVPKGIMHSHRSGLAWAEVSADAYDLRPDDKISNYAPLHFDLSTLDFFAAPLVGAATVMIPEDVTKIPASLAQLIAEEELTVFYTVPLALTQLALSGCISRHDYSALRWVLFGGELMPPKHLASLIRQLPSVRFCNVYGPTETNGCTHFPIPPDYKHDQPVPIGMPYRNVEALVLDTDDQEVSTGEVGELVIRAPTLMRGYWGRDDLNASCSYFRTALAGVPDRFHRTGDLVVQEVDDSFRFIGRKDRQIKARGCRVDLDEVESVMLKLNEVSEAAVFPVVDPEGHLLIEASVIASGTSESEGAASADAGTSAAALRSRLRKLLPAYALPSRIDIVPSLPRTTNGKVDRLALAEIAKNRSPKATGVA